MRAMTHNKHFHSLLKETVIISTVLILNAKVFLYFFAEPIKFPVGFKLFLKYVLYKIHCCSKLFALACFYSWNVKSVRAWQLSKSDQILKAKLYPSDMKYQTWLEVETCHFGQKRFTADNVVHWLVAKPCMLFTVKNGHL